MRSRSARPGAGFGNARLHASSCAPVAEPGTQSGPCFEERSGRAAGRSRVCMDKHEVILALEGLLSEVVFGNGYLNYGYWPEGSSDQPAVESINEAQERYFEKLLETIPAGVETILDVGSGTGSIAAGLSARGFRVDCVSPSFTMNATARRKLCRVVRVGDGIRRAIRGPRHRRGVRPRSLLRELPLAEPPAMGRHRRLRSASKWNGCGDHGTFGQLGDITACARTYPRGARVRRFRPETAAPRPRSGVAAR